MEANVHRKLGRPKIEVERCYTKRHEGERSTETRSTRLENFENENSMDEPQNYMERQEMR